MATAARASSSAASASSSSAAASSSGGGSAAPKRESSLSGSGAPAASAGRVTTGAAGDGAPATATPATSGAAKKKPRRRLLPAPLTVTANAAARIAELLSAKPDAIGVRLGVRTRGCNGLSYTLDYAEGKEKFEEEVPLEGGKLVLVEPKALMHIVGTEMDYVEDVLSAEFVFHNPNAVGECGCGESFNVK